MDSLSSVRQLQSADMSGEAGRPQGRLQDVKQAVRLLNREIAHTDRFLDFSVDKDTGMTVVKVIDHDSARVIDQFPAEEIVDIARALGKMQGLFVKQTA